MGIFTRATTEREAAEEALERSGLPEPDGTAVYSAQTPAGTRYLATAELIPPPQGRP